jgi:hypothetical protein
MRGSSKRFSAGKRSLPCRLQFAFNFLPSGWAVLVIYANKFMDNSVNFVLILTCDFYSCFFEDFLKMPEVARNGRSL